MGVEYTRSESRPPQHIQEPFGFKTRSFFMLALGSFAFFSGGVPFRVLLLFAGGPELVLVEVDIGSSEFNHRNGASQWRCGTQRGVMNYAAFILSEHRFGLLLASPESLMRTICYSPELRESWNDWRDKLILNRKHPELSKHSRGWILSAHFFVFPLGEVIYFVNIQQALQCFPQTGFEQ